MMLKRFFRGMNLLLLLALGLCNAAHSICVENAAELTNALATWYTAGSGAVTTIKLARGPAYAITANYVNDQGGELHLLGGYPSGTTPACSGTRVINPTNTVLDGNSGDFTLISNGSITIEGLTMRNYTGSVGVYIDDDLNINVRSFIAQNDSQVALVAGSPIQVQNCLIFGQPHRPGNGALMVLAENGVSTVGNCTIADNGGDGFTLGTYNGGQLLAYNIIAWGNTGYDLVTSFGNTSKPSVVNSTFGTTSSGINQSANLNLNPKFVNEAGHDYHLESTILPISPAINAGTSAFMVASTDIEGHPRPVGEPDQGAYESTYDVANDFVVTSNSDASYAVVNGMPNGISCKTNSTTCTLRQAIISSNVSSGASRIHFQLNGGCPGQILVGAQPLPDITSQITIDGTTQPGWVANTNRNKFNANLCIVVNGSGASPYAFRVPAAAAANNARLIVKGLGFVGFSNEAIELENGTNHVIEGNQFGGILLAPNNYDAIRVTENSRGVTLIGSSANPSLGNLVVSSSSVGVYLDNILGNNYVAGNFIGLASDGLNTNPNNVGIYIYNSPNNIITDNYIDGNSSYGVEIAATNTTSNNVLNYNFIGINAAGLDAGNGAAGVLLFGAGASNNVIGASLSGAGGWNSIAFNKGPGVWLTNAGAGNAILENSIHDNVGLAIDLGAHGPDQNDPQDADSGSNNLQNYPLLSRVIRATSAEYIQGTLDSFYDGGEGFRLDFYLNPTCAPGPNARGDATQYLGNQTVFTSSMGHSSYFFTFPMSLSGALGYVTATATAPDGSTSEIGECILELPDHIFSDRFGS